jgi:hypothetical protein
MADLVEEMEDWLPRIREGGLLGKVMTVVWAVYLQAAVEVAEAERTELVRMQQLLVVAETAEAAKRRT